MMEEPQDTSPPGRNPSSPKGAEDSIWIPVGLVAFTLLVRLLTLPSPSLGGDAMHTWFMSRVLTEGLTAEPWVWDHHTARLGVVSISVAVQALFGSHALLYYVPALSMSCLQVVLLWKLGQRLGARIAAIIAVAGLVLSPGMVRTGADLLPEVFAGAYLLLGILLLLDHLDSEAPSWPRLAGAALAFFAAYMAKLPSALALPGILAAVWFVHGRGRDMWLLLGLIAALIGLETLLYAAFTDFPGGRLQVIASTHLTHPKLAPISFWDLFRRFDAKNMGSSMRHLLLAASFIGIALVFVRRTIPRTTWTLALTIASFVLGTTFAVKSIDPIMPAQPPVERYFNTLLPLIYLFVCIGLQQLFASQGVKLQWEPRRSRLVVGALCLFLAVWVIQDEAPRFLKRRTIPKLLEERDMANDAFSNGTPMVILWRDERPLKAVRDILLRDYADLGYEASAPQLIAGPRLERRQYFILLTKNRADDLGNAAAVEERVRTWQRDRKPVLRVQKGPRRTIVIIETTMDALAPPGPAGGTS